MEKEKKGLTMHVGYEPEVNVLTTKLLPRASGHACMYNNFFHVSVASLTAHTQQIST